MPTKMGSWHMIDRNEYEPQRTNNFEIVFPNLGSLFTIDQGILLPANSSELLTLSVKSVSSPETNIDKLTVSYGNTSVNFAGRPTYSDITIVVNDFIGLQTERILMAWSKKVFNPKDETIGFASDYKRDGYLIQYGPNGTFERKTQLRGCFPGTVSPGDFSNDDNSLREISVTFYVDMAIPLDS